LNKHADSPMNKQLNAIENVLTDFQISEDNEMIYFDWLIF
jgi:hypothetical protein